VSGASDAVEVPGSHCWFCWGSDVWFRWLCAGSLKGMSSELVEGVVTRYAHVWGVK